MKIVKPKTDVDATHIHRALASRGLIRWSTSPEVVREMHFHVVEEGRGRLTLVEIPYEQFYTHRFTVVGTCEDMSLILRKIKQLDARYQQHMKGKEHVENLSV